MWLFAGTVLAFMLIYFYGTRTFRYWSSRGVKHDPPIPFFGTAKRQFLQQISYAEIYDEMYWKYPSEKFVGYYLTRTPLLVLRDPELIKRILVTDFHHFTSRSLHPISDNSELMLKNLFSCEGDLWKMLRQRLSPAFSSARLKAMFPLIASRAEKLHQVAAKLASSNVEVDVRNLMKRYILEFAGDCGFGIDMDTINDENSLFEKIGQRIFNKTPRDVLVYFLKYIVPNWPSHLDFVAPFVENNIIALVKSVMKQRNYKPSGRKDFMDILLELREHSTFMTESQTKTNPDGSPCLVELGFDDELIAAQVFVFLGGGSQSSSTATSHTLLELAHHPEYQRKCQEEIDAVLTRYDNKLCYEAVKEMKFLEMCLCESLRKFPPIGFLMRKCVKRYTIPGTDVTLDPGVKVIVPVKSLHADPRYYDKPEQFRPDRFHPDNVHKIDKHLYLPFGDGPRSCIGIIIQTFPNPSPDARFNRYEIERFRTWVMKIGGDIVGEDTMFIHKNRRVCHRHFEEIYTLPNKRLTGLAIPTLHIPGVHVGPHPRASSGMSLNTGLRADVPEKVGEQGDLPKQIAPSAVASTSITFDEKEDTIKKAQRLGLMQSLAGLAVVLSRFSVAPGPRSPSTRGKPALDPKVIFVQSIVGGVPLILTPRILV